MATGFHMVAPNIFSVITAAFVVYVWTRVPLHLRRVESAKCLIIVGPQDGTCFISPFWHLEFVYGFHIFGKIVDCDENRMAGYYESGETETGKMISTRFMSSENIERNQIKLA